MSNNAAVISRRQEPATAGFVVAGQDCRLLRLRHELLHGDPPEGPQLDLLRVFHRRPESRVAFMTRHCPTDEHLSPLADYRVELLRDDWPGDVGDRLAQDGFFSINGYWKPGSRENTNLRALNAAYVDCDPYGLPWQLVVELVLGLIQSGGVPEPSIVARSGRGVWLFWLLRSDDDPTISPLARWYERDTLEKVNKEIITRVRVAVPELRPDPKCTDLARVCRVPGSVNSKAYGVWHTRYVMNGDAADLPCYRLHELAELVGIRPTIKNYKLAKAEPSTPERSADVEWRRKRAAKGLGALVRQRLDEFYRLAAHRNGFHQGTRHWALLALAILLTQLHTPNDQMEFLVGAAAAECHPPLQPKAAKKAIKSAREKAYKLTARKLAEWLGVSSEEADALGLRQIRPDFQPKRQRRGRDEKRILRRGLILEIARASAADGVALPRDNELCNRLSAFGLAASLATIRNDRKALAGSLAELGLKAASKGRPPMQHWAILQGSPPLKYQDTLQSCHLSDGH